MKVFITGASGYIGNSVAKAFRAKGHTVYGLVRSQDKANQLLSKEIWPIIGDLDDPQSYHSILEQVEVAVHCAFDNSPKAVEHDAKAIDAILSVFSQSRYSRSFLYTSGVWVYGSQGSAMVDESMPLNPLNIVKWRPQHEEKVLSDKNNLRKVIIRPAVVYGGTGGLMNHFFSSAQQGEMRIVGEGHNRWPMVHVQDLAYAYVSAAEKELSQVILNVADDSTLTVREMAEAVARAAKIEGKISVIPAEEAQQKFGPLIEGLEIDLTVNNSRAKRLLGWQIHHAPFTAEADLYYQAWLNQETVHEF